MTANLPSPHRRHDMIGTDGLLGLITQGQPNLSGLPSVLFRRDDWRDAMEIKTASGHIVLVDDSDFDLVKDHTWHIRVNERGRMVGAYTHPKIGHPLREKMKNVSMHRLIMGFPTCMVDHRSGNTLDNRRGNLRTATPAQNIWNSANKHTNTLGVRGVKKLRSGRFQALIEKDGVNIHLGSFDTILEAGAAYAGAAAVLHGKYVFTARNEARINRRNGDNHA